MGHKSRGNFKGICVRRCANRALRCDECLRFSCYVPREEKKDVKVKP